MGLGNPGSSYKNHRHNVGFWLIEALVKKHQLVKKEKPGYVYYLWDHAFGQTILVQSKRYMNDSGIAVQKVQSFYKYSLEDVWVAYDDMDFLPGDVKIRLGGGAGGHNGIKSIMQQMGKDFYRLRFGVGRPVAAEVKNYVLSAPSGEDREKIKKSIERVLVHIDLLCGGQYAMFIEKIHSKS